MKKITLLTLLCAAHTSPVWSQENLAPIEVTDKKQDTFSESWEENHGTQIYSGKKNTITDLDKIPELQTNNYRQATSQTPGLLISEIPNEALAAMTYRGLGDPHESYNILLLQDGIPVAADMYGYPAHYFSPALPMMDKFQFIRGGAGLLFGPQPGGVVNYISSPLERGQKNNGKLGLTYGSYNLISSNNAFYGSKGNHAYGIEYYRRQGDGPQRENSDFTADYVQLRDHIFNGKNKYSVSFNGYNSDHGETGGFAKEDGPDANVFGDDLGRATKKHDRLKVSRAQLSLGVESRINEDSRLEATLWATAYNRYSKRQNGSRFGQTPTGTDNSITTQKYYGYNGQIRYLQNYTAFGEEHTFSGGYLNYNLISPIHTETGNTVDSNSGTTTLRSERQTHVNSVFAENRFTFGKLMVTPGVRVENITQEIEERKNVNVTGELRETQTTENVPLFGLGLSYHLTDSSQIYANASEAYKPITYSDGLPTDPNTVASSDLEASNVWNYELGYRGQTDAINWDVSAFFIRYENQIGERDLGGGNSEIINTGAGTHKGFDLAGELKLSNFSDSTNFWSNFSLYANLSVLDARFTTGPLKDKTPQYAPKTITRAGIIYDKEDSLNIALMGVFVGQHFGDDANTSQREIPGYTIFDLTADWMINKNWEAHAGINNLLDKEYYSRVRSDGLIWALDRNYYAGVSYKF